MTRVMWSRLPARLIDCRCTIGADRKYAGRDAVVCDCIRRCNTEWSPRVSGGNPLIVNVRQAFQSSEPSCDR